MLHIGQINTTNFKSKVSSEKMAIEKISKLIENPNLERNTGILKYIETYCRPEKKNIQVANNYLNTQAAKISSKKMAAEKLAKLTEVL